ncbi:MAG: type II secretion system protein [Bacilli bacterium]|nr:type II secretion system protein [Bacilli bacterium]
MIFMKKNGFTLVELLAVIVIMALLLTIAVPAVIGIANSIRANMFCSKVDNIESAAKTYGNDYADMFENASDSFEITVADLIDNNLYKKESNDCKIGNSSNPCIKDPRDGKMMDNDKIKLSKRDKRIFAEYQLSADDKKTCSK